MKIKGFFFLKNSRLNNLFVFFVFIILCFWVSRYFLAEKYFYAHDLYYNLVRSLEAYSALKEGHFPLRWAGNLNYGCGAAVFNFFYPLGYYLMSSFFLFFGDILIAWKALVFISLLLGSWFFFLWIRNEIKDDLVSFVGALLYLLAPYRFSLVFVRGSFEFLTYAILPLVFLFSSRFFLKSKKPSLKVAFFLSVFFCFYLLSHNIAVLISFPLLLFYLFAKILICGLKGRFLLIVSFVLGFLMASFFIGPALLEKKYVRLSDPYVVVNYQYHFPALGQLIRSRWDYFFSLPGENDGMSFMLGYAQWLVLILSFSFVTYLVLFKKVKIGYFLDKYFWLIFYFIFSLLSIFFMLPQSIFLWKHIGIMEQIQFPWRILGVSVFLISALSSYFLVFLRDNFNRRLFYIIMFSVLLLSFLGNRNHLRVLPAQLQDYNIFEEKSLRYSTTTVANEILPRGDLAFCESVDSFVDNGQISDIKRGSVYGSFKLKFSNLPEDKVILALSYFPGSYKFSINGKEDVEYFDCRGRVCISAKEFVNYNYVSWRIVQTGFQKIFNLISISSLFIWFMLILIFYKRKYLWLLVLAVYIFFRLYNLQKVLPFGWDQERDAFVVSEILRGKFTLIGPRVVGPEGFFLPPYFFYILAPFYLLSKGDPYFSLYAFLIFSWLLFFIFVYKFLSRFLGRATSLIFLVIWSILPASIVIERIAWNPVFIPFVFLLLVFCFYKYCLVENLRWFFALCFFYFLGISFHVQALFYFPFILVLIFKGNRDVILKRIILLFASFFVVFLPIVIFDFRHNFLNISLLFSFNKFDLSDGGLLDVWTNFVSFLLSRTIGITTALLFYLVFLSLSLFLFVKLRDFCQKRLSLVLFLIIFSFPFAFIFYSGRPSEYYFNFALPVFALIVSMFYLVFLRQKMKIFLFFLVLLLLVFRWFAIDLRRINYYNGESLYFKTEVINFIKNISEGYRFDISIDSVNGKDAGFYYLLDFYGLDINKNDGSSLIRIVEPSDSACIARFGSYSVCLLPWDFGW